MRRIDPKQWPRAAVYAWYRAMSYPYVGITAEVDATALVGQTRAAGRSLFAAVMQQLVLAANEVPQLRQRIRLDDSGEWVAEHPRVDPAYTVAVEGGLFNYATTPSSEDPDAFAAGVAASSEAQRHNQSLEPFEGRRDDVLYMSCLPWIRFSAMSHPFSLDEIDSVPRIAWGKLVELDGRWRCPVNIVAHHALVDGSHIGRFFTGLEARLEALSSGRAR